MLKKSMKKALTLKLIASFIISFALSFFISTENVFADTVQCSRVRVSVVRSTDNHPVGDAAITIQFHRGTITGTTGNTPSDMGWWDTIIDPPDISDTGWVQVNKSGFQQGFSTLDDSGGMGVCTTLVRLTPEGLSCDKIKVRVTDAGDSAGVTGVPQATVNIFKVNGEVIQRTVNDSGRGEWNFSPAIAVYEDITAEHRGFRTNSGIMDSFCIATVSLARLPTSSTNCDLISGIVKNELGAGISGATVSIINSSSAVIGTATTGSNGVWSWQNGGTIFSVSRVEAETSGRRTGSTTDITPDPTIGCTAGDIIISSAGGPGGPGGPGFPGANLPTAAVPEKLMGNIQLLAIAIGTIIAIIRIILGALQIAGGGDNPIALEAGRDMITSSILGLLVILFAVTLLRVIGSSVLGIIN